MVAAICNCAERRFVLFVGPCVLIEVQKPANVPRTGTLPAAVEHVGVSDVGLAICPPCVAIVASVEHDLSVLPQRGTDDAVVRRITRLVSIFDQRIGAEVRASWLCDRGGRSSSVQRARAQSTAFHTRPL